MLSIPRGFSSHFLVPPPRHCFFFSVWRVAVRFPLCGGSWLGCAFVPASVEGLAAKSGSLVILQTFNLYLTMQLFKKDERKNLSSYLIGPFLSEAISTSMGMNSSERSSSTMTGLCRGGGFPLSVVTFIFMLGPSPMELRADNSIL